MFRYYNYRLIESNRSYSTEKIEKLLKIHPQTIREWINSNKLEYVSKKPILIYGGVLKEFIKNRNESHKKILAFNEIKCLRCKSISTPKDNEISLYHNKNGSIRVSGICSNCESEFSKLYKKNSLEQLKTSFFIKPVVSTLYNTSSINSNTHLESQKEEALNESKTTEETQQIDFKGKIKNEISIKAHVNQIKVSSKANIKQQLLFDL